MKRDDKTPDSAGHEDRDIDVRGVGRLAILLAAVMASAMGITWVLMGSLTREEQAGYVEPPPIAAGRPTEPPEPRLSPAPPKRLEALRAQEKQILETYDWEDESRGVVRIPIAAAMDLLAARGLPSRKPRAVLPPISHPTQSTLGEVRENKP